MDETSVLIVPRDDVRIEAVVFGGTIRLDGCVEGDVRCACLVITPAGQVDGAVSARTVHLDGTVNGPIDADKVILGPTAVIKGNITYGALTIATGASVSGICRDRNRTRIRPFDGATPACPPPLTFRHVPRLGRATALDRLPPVPALACGATSMKAVWEARQRAASAIGSPPRFDAIVPSRNASDSTARHKMQRGIN